MKAFRDKFREVAFTKYNYIEIAWKQLSFITPTKIVESDWRDNMINNASWPIILPNMKAIASLTTEELHLQMKQDGQTNERTHQKTICPPVPEMDGRPVAKCD